MYMKIYVDGLSSRHLESFKLKDGQIETIKYIYSKQGIYIILKNQIKNTIITDRPIQHVEKGGYKMLLDNSEITMDKVVHHIPLNHLQDIVNKTIYKLSNELSLIVEQGSFSPINIYFSTLSQSISHITEEIHSFLYNKVNL